MHSFIIFTQEKKKGQSTLWPGPWQFTIIYDLSPKGHLCLVWHFCSFLCRWGQPPPLPPVDGCDIVTAPFFFFLIVLLNCTYFWLHWWWNIDDGRPTFPLPTLSPFHPSLFLFSKMYCPLFFTSPIPPHHHPSAHVFSHLLSPPTSVSFHIYPISLWLPAKQIIS